MSLEAWEAGDMGIGPLSRPRFVGPHDLEKVGLPAAEPKLPVEGVVPGEPANMDWTEHALPVVKEEPKPTPLPKIIIKTAESYRQAPLRVQIVQVPTHRTVTVKSKFALTGELALFLLCFVDFANDIITLGWYWGLCVSVIGMVTFSALAARQLKLTTQYVEKEEVVDEARALRNSDPGSQWV
jgi:hypothetical protein